MFPNLLRLTLPLSFLLSLTFFLVSCGSMVVKDGDSTLLDPDEIAVDESYADSDELDPVIRGPKAVDLDTLAVPEESMLNDFSEDEEIMQETSISEEEFVQPLIEDEELADPLVSGINPADVKLVESWTPTPDPEEVVYDVANIIYFEFNQDRVQEKFNFSLEQHAKFLTENPGYKMVLEGHTDERGPRSYNLTLGENRSKAVANALIFYGAKISQIEVVSYGEEKPLALEHNEAAWAKNRRVEIIYEE